MYERYFEGEDKKWATQLGRVRYSSGLKHDVRSIAKSMTSLLVGMAVERGWIANLDEPIFSFYPEHAGLRTPEKDLITLRDALGEVILRRYALRAAFGPNCQY